MPKCSLRRRWTRLERLRFARGWRQADIATLLGISVPYYSQIESGARGVRPELFKAIADLFDVDPEDLAASRPKVVYPNPPLQRGRRMPRTDSTGAGAA